MCLPAALFRRRQGTPLALTALIAASGLLPACQTYQPQSLPSAQAIANAWEQRRLTDAGLAKFIAQQPASCRPASWPPARLNVESLTWLAWYFHPDMDRARAAVDAVMAGEDVAAARPNPNLGMSLTRIQFGAATLASPWAYGPTLDIPIETAGKRGLRIKQAKHQTQQARLALAQAAWQVHASVRDACLEYADAQTQAQDANISAQLRQQLLDTLLSQVQAGALDAALTYPAQREQLSALRVKQEADQRMSAALMQLAMACGVPRQALEDRPLDLHSLALPPQSSLHLRAMALTHRLDIRSLIEAYAAAETQLQLEIAKQYPDIHLNPGYAWDQGDQKYTIGFNLELPIFNHNQGAIRMAKARRLEAATAFNASQNTVLSEVPLQLKHYEAALANLALAKHQVQQTQAQWAAAKQLLAAGAVDRQRVQESEIIAADTTHAVHMATHAARLVLAQMEDFAQTPLFTSSRQSTP